MPVDRDRANAGRGGPRGIGFGSVANVDGLGRLDSEPTEGGLEHRRLRLRCPNLGARNNGREVMGDTEAREHVPESAIPVAHDAQPQAARGQAVEGRMHVGKEFELKASDQELRKSLGRWMVTAEGVAEDARAFPSKSLQRPVVARLVVVGEVVRDLGAQCGRDPGLGMGEPLITKGRPQKWRRWTQSDEGA